MQVIDRGLEECCRTGRLSRWLAPSADPSPSNAHSAERTSSCRTNIIVLPAAVYETIGTAFTGGMETELQFRDQIKTDKAKTGDRLAIADVDGRYTCSECGHEEQLPPAHKLRRLEKEQRGPAERDDD